MPDYRIYVIASTGRRMIPVDIKAPSDHHALQAADAMRQDGVEVEVWSGTRMVKPR